MRTQHTHKKICIRHTLCIHDEPEIKISSQTIKSRYYSVTPLSLPTQTEPKILFCNNVKSNLLWRPAKLFKISCISFTKLQRAFLKTLVAAAAAAAAPHDSVISPQRPFFCFWMPLVKIAVTCPNHVSENTGRAKTTGTTSSQEEAGDELVQRECVQRNKRRPGGRRRRKVRDGSNIGKTQMRWRAVWNGGVLIIACVAASMNGWADRWLGGWRERGCPWHMLREKWRCYGVERHQMAGKAAGKWRGKGSECRT